MCIFINQLYQTQKQKLMMNRKLEFQLQSHGHKTVFILKKKSYTTCSEKHLENTHADYQRKGYLVFYHLLTHYLT